MILLCPQIRIANARNAIDVILVRRYGGDVTKKAVIKEHFISFLGCVVAIRQLP